MTMVRIHERFNFCIVKNSVFSRKQHEFLCSLLCFRDVNSDNKFDMAEVIRMLQKIAGLR